MWGEYGVVEDVSPGDGGVEDVSPGDGGVEGVW